MCVCVCVVCRSCVCMCVHAGASRLDCFSHEGSFCVNGLAALIHTGLVLGGGGVAPFAGCCKVVGGTGCVKRDRLQIDGSKLGV